MQTVVETSPSSVEKSIQNPCDKFTPTRALPQFPTGSAVPIPKELESVTGKYQKALYRTDHR